MLYEPPLTALADVDMTGYAVSYAMSEELTVSLGRNEVGYEAGAGKSDQEATGISASYTMGSMTLAGVMNDITNQGSAATGAGNTTSNNETFEVNLSFAF